MSKVGPLLLILGLIVAVYLVNQKTHFFSKAAPDYTPQEVKISNLSDNSFTVTWVTTTPAKGFISFGISESLGNTSLDERDEVEPQIRLTHHVTLQDLAPETVYYFKIGSGPGIFDNQGTLFQQKTAPTTPDTPPLADPLFGTVINPDHSIPAEAIIYLMSQDGTILSSFTNEEGNWLITLNNARTKDLNSYLSFNNDQPVSVSIEAGTDGSLKKDIKLESRDLLELVLEVPSSSFVAPPELKLQDFNGDGVINVFDYVILRLKLLVK